MQTVRHANISEAPSLLPLVEAKTHAFVAGQRRRPAHHFFWHYHPETQLLWSWRGRGLRYVGRSVARFEPGDLVLIGANLPHTWVADEGDALSTVIHFLPERWGADFWQLPELQQLRRLLARGAQGLQFTGPEAWTIGQAIEDLAARPAQDFGSLIAFLTICEQLVRAPHHSLNALPGKAAKAETDPRLHQILEWIQRRAAEPITQEEAAAEAGLSPAAFSRWFKGRVGCVFHRYLNRLRVAMVCTRLSSGQSTITEAAFQSGYNNLANFNRRFREITGLTPKEFRGQTRRMQQDAARTVIMQLGRHGAVRIAPMGAAAAVDGREGNGRGQVRL